MTIHARFSLVAVGIFIGAAMLAGCASSVPAKAAPEAADIDGPTIGHFEASWSDEFNGPAIDSNKWYVVDRHDKYWPETPWRRNYKAQNVWTQPETDNSENRVLVIRTTEEKPLKDGTRVWSTGCILTKDGAEPAKFEQKYGRFEARLKFPTQQGHWCAFWLMNDNAGKVNGNGRDGTEIDIIEKAHTSDWVNHALHWDGYDKDHKSADQQLRDLGLNDGNWHTFRVDWYPDRYIFFVDGQETWRTDDGGVCQTPNFIILSEEIGNFGDTVDDWGSGPISKATMPDYFYVDWVRVSKWVKD